MRNFVRIFQPIVHAKQLEAKQAVLSRLLRIRPVNCLSARKHSPGFALPSDRDSPQKSARELEPPRRKDPVTSERSARKPRPQLRPLAVDDEQDFRSSALRSLR